MPHSPNTCRRFTRKPWLPAPQMPLSGVTGGQIVPKTGLGVCLKVSAWRRPPRVTRLRHHALPGYASRGPCAPLRHGAQWRMVRQRHFGHSLLLLETFVDPRRFHGGGYRAANWRELGKTRGYRRTRAGYSNEVGGAEGGVRAPAAPPRHRLAHPSRPRPAGPCRDTEDATRRPPNAPPSPVFCRHSRSAPSPRAPAPPAGGAGHCDRRHPVRHARLQGDGRMGRRSGGRLPGRASAAGSYA